MSRSGESLKGYHSVQSNILSYEFIILPLHLLLVCCTKMIYYYGHRRTGQHPFGGGRPSFARMDSVGGGVVAEIFPGSMFSGGG